MRDTKWYSKVNDLLSRTNNVINNGFKAIDPFKKYQKYFTYFIDLRKNDPPIGTNNIFSNLKSEYSSSCDDSIGKADQYVFFQNTISERGPFAEPIGFVFYDPMNEIDLPLLVLIISNYQNSGISIDRAIAAVIMHEMGHSIAGLLDEYLYQETGSIKDDVIATSNQFTNEYKNCSTKPSKDFRSSINNILYASVVSPGCSFLLDYTKKNLPPNTFQDVYFRPGADNLMRGQDTTTPKFDVISCGYIISAIKREPLDKVHAEKWWPECMTLDTARNGIPKINLTPKQLTISSISLTPGDPTITGVGFTATGNSVQLKNIAHPSIIYDIIDIPSPDTTTISFIVPISVTPGKYSLKVGAFNSPWSKPITVTVYPELSVSGASCTYVKDITSKSVFTFQGNIMGGLAPYTQILTTIMVNNSKKTASIKIPGTYTLNTTLDIKDSSILVKSKDGQKVSIQCTQPMTLSSMKTSSLKKVKDTPVSFDASQIESTDDVITEPVQTNTTLPGASFTITPLSLPTTPASSAASLDVTSSDEEVTTNSTQSPVQAPATIPAQTIIPVITPATVTPQTENIPDPTPPAPIPSVQITQPIETTQPVVQPTIPTATPILTKPATLKFTCPNLYVFNGISCTFGGSKYTIPATLKYVCPAGYKISSTSSKTCVVAITSFGNTANVWSALLEFVNRLFGL